MKEQNKAWGTRQTCQNLPFGDASMCNGTDVSPLHFTSLEHDSESNTDHTEFRHLSSMLGRWLSPDPAGLAAADLSNPQSLNLYEYVMNSPLNFVDPLGLWCVWFVGTPQYPVSELRCSFDGSGSGSGRPTGPIHTVADYDDTHPRRDPSDAANNGFTLGVRAPGQTWTQCMPSTSGTYSINGVLPSSWQNGATRVLAGNDVSQILFGDSSEGSAGLVGWEGGSRSVEAGVGEAMTAGRRTASVFNLAGRTGPAPMILGKTGAEKLAGFLTGVAEIKMAIDVGVTGAQAIGCAIHR